MDLVEARGLTKDYGTGDRRRCALDSVDLTVAAGEFVAVVGPSGSGKTTLLQLLAGMASPTSGSVRIGDLDLSRARENELVNLRRSTVGFVFQDFNLIPVLSAIENVALPMMLARRPVQERSARASGLLESVGLNHRVEARPSELSGGEQQRVAIARALVNSPRLLLADEPTGSLDTQTGLEVMRLFADLRAEHGCAIVAVTHDMRMASTADRILRLRDGRVVDVHVPDRTAVSTEELDVLES